MRYRYISEFVSESCRGEGERGKSFMIPCDDTGCGGERGLRINILALGDVGSTVLLGLRLIGGAAAESIGIYDIDERVVRRFEREMNQIRFPDGRRLPPVKAVEEESLFDCDMMVFCASKGVPPLGAQGDVRMAQLEANSGLVKLYAGKGAEEGFRGIFAVVSDPVDPLCMAAVKAGLKPAQVQGYGLGVMNGRAAYYSERDRRFSSYLTEGRAFGPHGGDLVIANSVKNYDPSVSEELTRLTVEANMEMRREGFKPYIAPAMSSGAISLAETAAGRWSYSSVYLGSEEEGAFLGCRNRRGRTEEGGFIEVEDIPLPEELFNRIKKAYDNLKERIL